jgi:hypothetical protein
MKKIIVAVVVVVVAGGYHVLDAYGLFNEADTYRVPALTAILYFFDTGKFPA